MYGYNDTDRKLRQAQDDADYYRRQYEEIQDRQNRQDRERLREQDERRQQQQREWQESLNYAHDWPEAFRNNDIKLNQEASFERGYIMQFPDDPLSAEPWFHKQVAVNTRAQEVYAEAEKEVQEQIAALLAGVRQKTIETIRAEFGKDADVIAASLEQNDPTSLVNW